MEKIHQKLEIITNFIKNFLYKKKLVIFLGKKGIKIIAYHKHGVVNSIFIDNKDPELHTTYQTFLKKHKKFQVSFLLDSEDCQLKHEFMPMLQSIIKFDPVEKFIEENYKPEDIIAYYVYNIDYKNGEVWEAIVASLPYDASINKLLEFVIDNSFRLGGVYFLSLEFESIINGVLERQNLSEYEHDLQIFVTITEGSDVRIATKYMQNILDESLVVFPLDKSDLYIVGTIEQAVSDIILKYKGYVKSLDLETCLIFLVDKALCDLLLQSTLFQPYKIVTYHHQRVSFESNANTHFQDNDLLELFLGNKKHPALNRSLRLIEKLTKIDRVVFKPLGAVVIAILVTLIAFKYQAITIKSETIELNNKYYSLSEKYRNMKKRHPDIENITNLADLYNLQTLVDVSSPTPFDSLKKVLSLKNANIEIVAIDWYAKNSRLVGEEILLTFDILYINNKKDVKLAAEAIDAYTQDAKIAFKGYKVILVRDDENITELSKKLLVPAKIIISER